MRLSSRNASREIRNSSIRGSYKSVYVIFILLLLVSQLNLLYDVAPSLNKEEEKNASIKFLTVERGKKHLIDDVLSEVNTSKIGFTGKPVLKRLERASLKLKSETTTLISGDWNVTGNETYINEEIVLTGDSLEYHRSKKI